MSHVNRRFLYKIAALAIILLVALAWWRHRHHAALDQVSTSVPVTTTRVVRRDVPVYINALGTVTAIDTVAVHPQVSGTLTAVLFREGQAVAAGDVLARIDDRPFKAELLSAEGKLEQDKALLENDRRDLDRYRSLVKAGSVTQQTVDTQAALVRQYEGAVEADRGSVDSARVQLGYATVTTPLGGVVGLRGVDAGNVVQTSDTIATVTSINPISVKFAVPEDDIDSIRNAERTGALTVIAFDRTGTKQLATGTLSAIDNLVDTTTGTVMMRAVFANGDRRLFPNQFVKVRLRVDTLRAALLVPTRAIQYGVNGELLFVAEHGKAKLRKVETGPADGNDTVVTGQSIRAGERVIVDGADNLDDGSVIRIDNPSGTPVAATTTH